MKRILALMLVLVMSTSVISCGKKEAEIPQDQIEINEEEKAEAVIDDGFSCDHTIEGLSNITLQEVLDAGYEFAGHTKYNDEIILLVSPIDEVAEIKNLIDSLDGKTIAEFKEMYQPTFGYIDLEDHTSISAGFGYISIWFEIEHSDEAVALCKEDETLELGDVEVIQNDPMYNIGVGKLFLSASLTEDSHKKVASLDSININTISDMASELTIEFVGYNTK